MTIRTVLHVLERINRPSCYASGTITVLCMSNMRGYVSRLQPPKNNIYVYALCCSAAWL